jgi:hypothetical protein
MLRAPGSFASAQRRVVCGFSSKFMIVRNSPGPLLTSMDKAVALLRPAHWAAGFLFCARINQRLFSPGPIRFPAGPRCESSEYPDNPVFSRLAGGAPQRLKL